MSRFRIAALIVWALTCAGCVSRDLIAYPGAAFNPRPYTALERAREALDGDAVLPPPIRDGRPDPAPRMASAAVLPPPAASAFAEDLAPPALSSLAAIEPESGAEEPTPQGDQAERFACADGSALAVSYSADRSVATVRRDDAEPIDLAWNPDAVVPTYASGFATLRRAGPRVAWSQGGGESRVTVQPGDTLSAIARAHYGSIDRVDAIIRANAEQIADPDLIFPGQVLVLPDARGGDEVVTSCRRTLGPVRA